MSRKSNLSKLRPLRARSVPFVGALVKAAGGDHSRELVYLEVLTRQLADQGYRYAPRPIKGAASSSLLYLVAAFAAEPSVTSVLELGAGESTVLLHEIAERRGDLSVETLEHDETWAAILGERVHRRIVPTPLTERRISGRVSSAYDLTHLGDRRFDLVIVDGPQGTPRRSRWGALEIVERHLADEFILVFDDAGRRGELDTVAASLRLLAERGRDVDVGITITVGGQVVIVTPRFRHLRFT